MSWSQNSACKDPYIRCLRVVDFELATCVAIGNLDERYLDLDSCNKFGPSLICF